MKTIKTLMMAMWVGAGLLFSGLPALTHDDAEAIKHLMMHTFDKPEAPLTVDPVTVSGDLAVAGWAQGDMGGRALLKQKEGQWALVLCSGDALKEASSLVKFGLSSADAQAMAAEVVAAEAKLDGALVAKFSTFDGVVMMDAHGAHPHVAPQN